MSIEDTLEERGERYGDFADHASIAQGLQNAMRTNPASNWDSLSDVQKQALTAIADKIARILSGDPNYTDNWHDIQGYAKLAEERCVSFEPPSESTGPLRPFVTIDIPAWVAWTFKKPHPDLDSGTGVEIELRNGTRRTASVGELYWDKTDSGSDIIKYRVL